MNCEEAREYLREALVVPEDEAVRDHLDACADCRGYAKEIAMLGEALRSPAPEPAPAEWARLHNTVYATVRARRASRARRRTWEWRLSPAALATAAAIFLFVVQPARLNNQTGLTGVTEDKILSAVYSDYTSFHETEATATQAAIDEKQAWTAQHLLRSGSPTELTTIRNDVQTLTQDEMETLIRKLDKKIPKSSGKVPDNKTFARTEV